MSDSVNKLNSMILEVYAKHCVIVRENELNIPVHLFPNHMKHLAEKWLTILNQYEFSTLTVDSVRDLKTEGVYYAPILTYSDGYDILKSSWLRE